MVQLRWRTTNTRLEFRLAAVLCYLLWVLGGMLILSAGHESRFVRFHARQSILFCGLALMVLAAPLMAGQQVLTGLLALVAGAAWLVLMVRAARGEWVELPWLGAWAERSS